MEIFKSDILKKEFVPLSKKFYLLWRVVGTVANFVVIEIESFQLLVETAESRDAKVSICSNLLKKFYLVVEMKTLKNTLLTS